MRLKASNWLNGEKDRILIWLGVAVRMEDGKMEAVKLITETRQMPNLDKLYIIEMAARRTTADQILK